MVYGLARSGANKTMVVVLTKASPEEILEPRSSNRHPEDAAGRHTRLVDEGGRLQSLPWSLPREVRRHQLAQLLIDEGHHLLGGVVYRSEKEARAFLTWIDQFELLLRARNQFPTPQHRQQSLEQLEAARQVCARIIRDARE